MTEKGKPWHALVVDDEEHNVDMLSRRLRRRGYTVSTALSAREALEQLSIQAPDIFLLDIMMPEVNGLELLGEIRRIPTVADLPVILVSALGETDDIVRGLELGANDYVTKPIDLPVLIARMEAQLKRAAILASSQRQVTLLKKLAEVDAALIKSYEKQPPPAKATEASKSAAFVRDQDHDTADYQAVSVSQVGPTPPAREAIDTAEILAAGEEQITIEEVIFTEALTQEVQTQISKTYWDSRPLSLMLLEMELEMNLEDGYGESDAEDLLRQFIKRTTQFLGADKEMRRLDWGLFCVFLTNTDEPKAITIANDLLLLIKTSIFERAVIKASGRLHIGLATYDPNIDGSSPDLAERGRLALNTAREHERSIWVAP